MNKFLTQYEAILFVDNSVAFQEVITTLLGFPSSTETSMKMVSAVSENYLTSKQNLFDGK
jgi:hypothetical protein